MVFLDFGGWGSTGVVMWPARLIVFVDFGGWGRTGVIMWVARQPRRMTIVIE